MADENRDSEKEPEKKAEFEIEEVTSDLDGVAGGTLLNPVEGGCGGCDGCSHSGCSKCG